MIDYAGSDDFPQRPPPPNRRTLRERKLLPLGRKERPRSRERRQFLTRARLLERQNTATRCPLSRRRNRRNEWRQRRSQRSRSRSSNASTRSSTSRATSTACRLGRREAFGCTPGKERSPGRRAQTLNARHQDDRSLARRLGQTARAKALAQYDERPHRRTHS
jgi:hypothetical protein